MIIIIKYIIPVWFMYICVVVIWFARNFDNKLIISIKKEYNLIILCLLKFESLVRKKKEKKESKEMLCDVQK